MQDSENNIIEGMAFLGQHYQYLLNASTSHDEEFVQATVQNTMFELCKMLNKLRSSLPSDSWKNFGEMARNHPIKELLHQDPFTKRVHDKPRGYAGDAKMLDYLYYGIKSQEQVSLLGREIQRFLRGSPAGFAVRERAELINKTIEQMLNNPSRKNSAFRVLSIASGHAREIGISPAIFNSAFYFTALDADIKSLKKVKETYSEYNIEILPWSVSRLIKKEDIASIGQFDLVYSCGLYDYLNDFAAQKLTEVISNDLLKPGGKAIIANFLDHFIRGYMEIFMNWNLIYRDMPSFEKLSHSISTELIKNKKTFKDTSNAIVYLEINKASVEEMNIVLIKEPNILKAVSVRSKL